MYQSAILLCSFRQAANRISFFKSITPIIDIGALHETYRLSPYTAHHSPRF